MRAPVLKTVRCKDPGCRLKSFKQKHDALHHTHAPSTSLATVVFFNNGSVDTMAAAFQDWDTIDIDVPFERDTMALAIFSSLLRNMFMEFDRNAVSVAIPSIIHLAFRGNNRVLHSRDLEDVIVILQHSVENKNADEF